MKKEYDFSKGERGKFFRPDAQLNLPVCFDPDLARMHPQEGDASRRRARMSDRNWYKYDFMVGNKIVHSGITTDLERRQQEHQQRWPRGHIVQVGNATTEEAARTWEETKQKAVTPKRS